MRRLTSAFEQEPQKLKLAVIEILKFSCGVASWWALSYPRMNWEGAVSLLAIAPSKSGTATFAKPPRHHGDELVIPVVLDSVSKLQWPILYSVPELTVSVRPRWAASSGWLREASGISRLVCRARPRFPPRSRCRRLSRRQEQRKAAKRYLTRGSSRRCDRLLPASKTTRAWNE